LAYGRSSSPLRRAGTADTVNDDAPEFVDWVAEWVGYQG
jgi:hypothetical protein